MTLPFKVRHEAQERSLACPIRKVEAGRVVNLDVGARAHRGQDEDFSVFEQDPVPSNAHVLAGKLAFPFGPASLADTRAMQARRVYKHVRILLGFVMLEGNISQLVRLQ